MLALAVFAATPSAAADPPARTPTKEETQVARELFEKALNDERGKDYAAALEKLEKAIALYETPGLRFHVAFCEEKLGRLAAALADYERAKQKAETDGKRDVLAEVQGPLASLAKRVPRVVIRLQNTPIAGAARPNWDHLKLTIDERPLNAAVLGTELPVDPGRHRITARAEGYSVESEVVDATEGATQAVNLTMRPTNEPNKGAEPATHPQDPPKMPTTTTSQGAGSAAGSIANSGTNAPSSKHGSATPWILAGGGVLLAGAGVGSLLFAGSKASDARDKCALVPRWSTCDASGDRSSVRLFDSLAIGAFVGAAALFTTAIVTSGSGEEKVVVSVAPNGVSVGGVFQ